MATGIGALSSNRHAGGSGMQGSLIETGEGCTSVPFPFLVPRPRQGTRAMEPGYILCGAAF